MGQIAVTVDATAAQDALRPYRNFINVLAGVVNDQSYPGQDGIAVNGTYQYQVIGPNGVAVEGSPYYVPTPSNAPLTLSPNFMMGALVLAAAFFLLQK